MSSPDLKEKQETIWAHEEFVPDLVSVIIPTYNRSTLIMDALDSIWKQSWKKIEIIVVDDGSTDGTCVKLLQLPKREDGISLSVLRQENAGPAAARNRGIRHSRGEFIYFLDSDDGIYPDALAKMVFALNTSGRQYCLANIRSLDIDGNATLTNVGGVSIQPRGKFRGASWFMHAALYRKSAIISAGMYDVALEIGEDTEFHWRIATTNGKGHHLNEYIGFRRQHGFGHLSFERSRLEVFQHSLIVCKKFQSWAKENNYLSRSMLSEFMFYYFVYGIEFASHGDWNRQKQAFAIFDMPEVRSEFWFASGLSWLGQLRGQFFFKVILGMIDLVRILRNAMRLMAVKV
jgi:glycosyltransferase involved in cell wall biosynthesis